MNKTTEEAAREAVRKEYLCESCSFKNDCDLCGGENTAFDCCECPADSYEDGFKAGANHVYKLPLRDRLTAEEKEKIGNTLNRYYDRWRKHTNEATEAVYCAIKEAFESIFGKEMFDEKEK